MATLGQLLQHTGARMRSQDKTAQLMLAISQLIAGTGKTFSSFAELGMRQKQEKRAEAAEKRAQSAEERAQADEVRREIYHKWRIEDRPLEKATAELHKKILETQADDATTKKVISKLSLRVSNWFRAARDYANKTGISTEEAVMAWRDATGIDPLAMGELEHEKLLESGMTTDQSMRFIGDVYKKHLNEFGSSLPEAYINAMGVMGAYKQPGQQRVVNLKEMGTQLTDSGFDPALGALLHAASDEEGKMSPTAKKAMSNSLINTIQTTQGRNALGRLSNLYGVDIKDLMTETVGAPYQTQAEALRDIGVEGPRPVTVRGSFTSPMSPVQSYGEEKFYRLPFTNKKYPTADAAAKDYNTVLLQLMIEDLLRGKPDKNSLLNVPPNVKSTDSNFYGR